MKTHRLLTLLTLLAATWLYAASPHLSPAADVSLDISSDSPRNVNAEKRANVVLRQCELNAAIKQYEKVLMETWEARLQKILGPAETGLTDEQQKQWLVRAESKLSKLEDAEDSLRAQIIYFVEEADKEKKRIEKEIAKELIEKEKAEEKAKPTPAPSQPIRP